MQKTEKYKIVLQYDLTDYFVYLCFMPVFKYYFEMLWALI